MSPDPADQLPDPDGMPEADMVIYDATCRLCRGTVRRLDRLDRGGRLIAFLVPVTLIFHDFWQYQGEAQMQQMIHFMKNSAILGGLLALLTHGAGPVSVDAATAKPRDAR